MVVALPVDGWIEAAAAALLLSMGNACSSPVMPRERLISMLAAPLVRLNQLLVSCWVTRAEMLERPGAAKRPFFV